MQLAGQLTGPTPTLPPVTVPKAPIPAPVAEALNQTCAHLASVVRQAGGNPRLLTLARASRERQGPNSCARLGRSCYLGATVRWNTVAAPYATFRSYVIPHFPLGPPANAGFPLSNAVFSTGIPALSEVTPLASTRLA